MPKKKNGARPIRDGIPDALFVAASLIPDCFGCSICLETTNEAVYTPCGHFFCEVCLSKVKDMAEEGSFECPNCRRECSVYTEAEVARTIISSQSVYCSESEDRRCGWTGPLRMLAVHLESGCSKSRLADRTRGRKSRTIGHKSFRRSELDELSVARLKDVIGKLLKNDEFKDRRAELVELPSEKEDLLRLACEVLQMPYEVGSADGSTAEEKTAEVSGEVGIVSGVTSESLTKLGESELRRWLNIRHTRHDYLSRLSDLVELVQHCLKVFESGETYDVEMETKSPVITLDRIKDLFAEAESTTKKLDAGSEFGGTAVSS